MFSQPNSVCIPNYRNGMTNKPSKNVLWDNVAGLMTHHYGKENLTRLAREAKLPSTASADRLKKQETSFGVDLIDQIAEAFKLDSWQLLVPGFDADNLPTLGGDASDWPMDLVDKQKYLALSRRHRDLVQGYVLRLLDELGSKENKSANGT